MFTRVRILVFLGAVVLFILCLGEFRVAPLEEENEEFSGEKIELSSLSDEQIEERFRERRKRAQDICQKSARNEDGSYGLKLRILFFWDYNVSICTMGKVGSETWRKHAMVLNHLPPVSDDGFRAIDDPRRIAFLKEPRQKILEYSNSLSKWISVRHPLTRLVSCYQDKYKNGSTGIHKTMFLIPALKSNGYMPGITTKETFTFKEFINHVIRSFEGGYVNQHWATYSYLCSPCFYNYDYITKTETQDEDLKYLFRKFKFPLDPGLAVKRKEDPSMKIKRDLSYFNDIPLEMRKKIVEIYQDDMTMYGYDLPEGFLL